MFNIDDKDTIMDIINKRDRDDMVIPLYIRIGNNRYSLLEVDDIPDCSPSIFKIGFGSSNSVFNTLRFPISKLINFDYTQIFNHYDEDKQATIQYIVFESSDINNDNSLLEISINKYYDMLLEYVMEHVEINKRERIKRTMEELS